MTPGGRASAAIEILDAVIAAAHDNGAAADTLVQRYFATRRYAGSKDRRAVRAMVYAAIRRAGAMPASGRAALVAVADADPDIAAAFDDSPHAPAPIDAGEPRAAGGVAPGWLIDALAGSGLDDAERAALIERAPLDLRVNTLRGDRATATAAFPDAVPTRAPAGLRLAAGTAIEASEAYRAGLVEVQDEGSQIVCLALDARPAQAVVDLCAGAGGKTLALAAAMRGEGALLACDTDRARLSRLGPRAQRAGADGIETRLLDAGREEAMLADWRGAADAVLVDAPCSGTGTWRRNPEARWRLTPARLDRLVERQAHVLGLAAPLVRPGGALVYVVCSVLDAEGPGVIDAFLASRPGWRIDPPELPAGRARGPGIRLTPAADGTDGFFVARLRAA